MIIPEKYVLEEGKDAPEGTQVATCKFCNRTFAVPTEELKGQKLADVCDNQACTEAHDKEVAQQVSALMKVDANKEGADAIKSALGS